MPEGATRSGKYSVLADTSAVTPGAPFSSSCSSLSLVAAIPLGGCKQKGGRKVIGLQAQAMYRYKEHLREALSYRHDPS